MRLAGHEQPIAHRWDERTEVALRRAVGGRDVEVVDAAGDRIGEGLLGLGGRAGPEGRTSQDGDGALVAGPAETSTLHGPIVPDGAPWRAQAAAVLARRPATVAAISASTAAPALTAATPGMPAAA